MVEFYLITFPRFPLRKKEHKYYFGKHRTHDFRTSRCAAYLLDHSGDERQLHNNNSSLLRKKYFFFLQITQSFVLHAADREYVKLDNG